MEKAWDMIRACKRGKDRPIKKEPVCGDFPDCPKIPDKRKPECKHCIWFNKNS